MRKFYLLFFFVVVSCSKNITNNNLNFFDEDDLIKLELKLEDYAKNSSYPNIDK